MDRYETPFGIRTVRWDPNKGFFLNGKRVELKGTCDHQDHAGVGVAVPDELNVFRVASSSRKWDRNAIRTSHNPPTPELLDACDRLGMLVMDENREYGINPNNWANSSSSFSGTGIIPAWSSGRSATRNGPSKATKKARASPRPCKHSPNGWIRPAETPWPLAAAGAMAVRRALT